MIYDFPFALSRLTPVDFLHPRYNALALCVLPITDNDRSKELSLLSSTYNRDRAIECLKRTGIDDYKVSLTLNFSPSVLFEVKRERERGEEEEKNLVEESSLVIKQEKDTRSCSPRLTCFLILFILLIKGRSDKITLSLLALRPTAQPR